MVVTYSKDKKHAYFNGEMFTRDERTGYYLSSQNHIYPGRRLHRVVWEYHNHPIPKGYHIHHIDEDKGNNDISNLKLMLAEEHIAYHQDDLTESEASWRRRNLKEKAGPRASEWHRSEKGLQWHKEQYAKTKDKLHTTQEFICANCGIQFEAQKNCKTRFCSNKCKAANRRKAGIDNVLRTCYICGKEFSTNKFKKAVCCSPMCAAQLRYRQSK